MLLPASFWHDRTAKRYTLRVDSSDVAFAYVAFVMHALLAFTVACSNSCMFHCAEDTRLLSRFRCGCHGILVDTGRWVGTERKERLCQVCHSLHNVEDEQHFIFDCPAYSHIRKKHANLFQQTCAVPGFIAQCEPNACRGFFQRTLFL